RGRHVQLPQQRLEKPVVPVVREACPAGIQLLLEVADGVARRRLPVVDRRPVKIGAGTSAGPIEPPGQDAAEQEVTGLRMTSTSRQARGKETGHGYLVEAGGAGWVRPW